MEIIKKLEQEGAIVFYYASFIPEFINNGKEYKSLGKFSEEEIKENDIGIITTDHSAVDYGMVAKNAKAIFDTRNAIKDDAGNVERL